MKSLRLRFTLWFGLSLFACVGVFMVVTHYHLEYELRREARERARAGNEAWSLHGAYSEAEVHDIVRELWRSALVYAGPILLLAFGVGFLLARRAFAPVAEMRVQLHAITARNLRQRVRLKDADEEFRAIEAAINALLTRLETTFAQLTEYSAQVAHEFRTPLTLMRLQVEEAAGKIEPDLAESLQDELARLCDYVDQCLLLARAEQGRLKSTLEFVELRTLLRDTLENFTLLARSERRELVLQAPERVTVQTDPRHLRQVLQNVLTNAIQHGTGAIRVTLGMTDEGAACRIENEHRRAPARQHPNAGLGLRIVRAITTVLEIRFRAGEDAKGLFVAELIIPKDRVLDCAAPSVRGRAETMPSPR